MKSFNYCRHVKQDGVPCGSPPLRGERYCYFHLRYKGYPLRSWPNKRRLGGLRINRGTAFNLKAAQASLKRVEKLLSSGTCSDPARVRLIRSALQMLVSDLRYMPVPAGSFSSARSPQGSDKSNERGILR